MSYTELWDYELTHEWETVFNQPVFHEMDRGYFEWLRHAQATN